MVPPRQEVTELDVALPRRFAKGTTPSGATYMGLAPERPIRPGEDDHTALDLSLSDRTATDVALDPTSPNLPLADRTMPGLVLPTVRSRAAR